MPYDTRKKSRLLSVYFKSNSVFPQTRFAFVILSIAEALPEFSENEIRLIIDDAALARVKRAMDLKHRDHHISKWISTSQLRADILKALQVVSRFKQAFLSHGPPERLEEISKRAWEISIAGDYSKRYLSSIAGQTSTDSRIGRVHTYGGPLSDLLQDLRANINIASADLYIDLLEPEMHHEVTSYSFPSITV
ncbi:hypothetical protein ACQKGC_28870 [Allorhizobium pseudoryzae]|uniref:hypothetical protein n=1 Tax=Allorhizobium pseudoryzae TaxID=379684 RepID=UPI003CFDED7F